MSKHTPGPWEYVDATKVASLQYRQMCIINAGRREIAAFSWNDNSPYFPTRAESQANARLIAAAPDLLAACEMAYLAAQDGSLDTDDINQLRAAIAKAEGREL